MRTKLKQLRLDAELTQASLAEKVGVTQPNYARWELGAAPIPEDKLKKLAKTLKTTPDTILGRHAPIYTHLYNKEQPDISYYGEAAVHFKDGGAPLLLTISESEFGRLHDNLQDNPPAFIFIESLQNQTVAIRTAAIADLYLSGEAYDDFGPEHDAYEGKPSVQIPDPRDWDIIAALELGDDSELEDFGEEHATRVRQTIGMHTDEEYKAYVANGAIEPDELENNRERDAALTKFVFGLARNVVYQLSGGKRRTIEDFHDEEDLYDVFAQFEDDADDDLVRLPVVDYHRVAFLSKSALDYISVPTRRLEQGRLDEMDELTKFKADSAKVKAPDKA